MKYFQSSILKLLKSYLQGVAVGVAWLTLVLSLTACGNKITDTQQKLNLFLSQETESAAHWLTKNIIVVNPLSDATISHIQLLSYEGPAHNANVKPITLSRTEFPAALKVKHPHLAKFQAFHIEISQQDAKALLKSGLVVAMQLTNENAKLNDGGTGQKMTRVQTANVIDDLYTQSKQDADEEQQLGATVTRDKQGTPSVSFKLWAPTAHKVNVMLFDKSDKKALTTLALDEDSNTGIWQTTLSGDYHLAYYQYEVTVNHDEYQTKHPGMSSTITVQVTDPYSLSLSTNSVYSQIIDLNHPITQPKGWQTQQDVALLAPEDAIIYETHIRDFSAAETALSKEQFRGKYKAFSEANSHGIKHLQELQQAGLNHIHLLPTFDLATIVEHEKLQISLSDTLAKVCNIKPSIGLCQQNLSPKLTLNELLATYDVNSSDAQQVIGEIRHQDNYNWGYDPFHYTVPEGSYAVNSDGYARIVEFREMVQSLHNMGFRVVMDVVYNHTHKAGLAFTSVLDKIVPKYYQRLHPITGMVEQSTCCDNTATERVMMEKLMIDSLVTWAKDYRIDGFRFDLMGHQPKSAMLKARDAVRAIDPDTYFYGEGWNFGEVANNQQFVQASQLELAGSEIGTFTDRLRDAVRGSSYNVSSFEHRKNQGIGNGLGTLNNDMQNNVSQAQYQQKMQQLRIGLTGNLANFELLDEQDNAVTGKQIRYGDQPAGYALDPADTINYVSKHDNQTLWDNSQYRTDYAATTAQRVRMHNQSLSYALLAQGIPFLHMGSELLRSKSFLRDSYDYGDWFNRVDYSKQSNNYNVGLPPKEKDEANWPLIKTLLAKNQGRDIVTASDIEFASKVFTDFIAIRASSPLFRLTSEQAIKEKVSFLNMGSQHQHGIIVMLIDDTKGQPVDDNTSKIAVVFNNNPNAVTITHAQFKGLKLHPRQQHGSDDVTKLSVLSTREGDHTLSIPAFTTAVFLTQH